MALVVLDLFVWVRFLLTRLHQNGEAGVGRRRLGGRLGGGVPECVVGEKCVGRQASLTALASPRFPFPNQLPLVG
jgi:hypothetical protein